MKRRKLIAALQCFGRVYIPHQAREDTVLFPALHEIVSPNQFDQLGDLFERRAHQLFGAHGFEHAVARVAEIEQSLGVNDLARFTPQ